MPDKCVWTLDDLHDYYETKCGQAFTFTYTKCEKEFKYCPYCGKEIEEAK